jgi:hypothetical protein
MKIGVSIVTLIGATIVTFTVEFTEFGHSFKAVTVT